MNDQARTVSNSYHPITQWALNYLNNAAQPIQRGIQGFQNPPKQYIGRDVIQNALDLIPGRSNVRGFMQGVFGQEATAHPQIAWGLDAEMPSDVDPVAAKQFAAALRSSGGLKQVSPRQYVSSHPSINQPIEGQPNFQQVGNTMVRTDRPTGDYIGITDLINMLAKK